MYKYIECALESNDYIHYEISNYAKKGYLSKHNLVYWNNDYYYGFGLSSTSYIDDIRRVNTKNLSKYLKGEYVCSEELENETIKMENEVMLGLRKFEGVDTKKFKDRYGKDIKDVFNIDSLLEDNYLTEDGYYIKINKKYMYVSNEIISRLFN